MKFLWNSLSFFRFSRWLTFPCPSRFTSPLGCPPGSHLKAVLSVLCGYVSPGSQERKLETKILCKWLTGGVFRRRHGRGKVRKPNIDGAGSSGSLRAQPHLSLTEARVSAICTLVPLTGYRLLWGCRHCPSAKQLLCGWRQPPWKGCSCFLGLL